jgi:hypothetical protein
MDAIRRLLLAAGLSLSFLAAADDKPRRAESGQSRAGAQQIISSDRAHTRAPTLEGAVIARLEEYGNEFPDILFVVLDSGDYWSEALVTISILLGKSPVSLDYEHPPEVREELMTLSVARLKLMLHHKVPSASLYRTVDQSGRTQTICVITVDPNTIAGDDQVATSHLLNLPQGYEGQVPAKFELRRVEYLNFVIDHETYHCLSSLYNGPQPRSFKPLWADHWHHREENGADAFALVMHRKRQGHFGDFADNLKRLRATAIVGADINHWTLRSLKAVMRDNLSAISQRSIRELFDYATAIRDEVVPDYDSYLRFVRSSGGAMEHLGLPKTASQESLELLDAVEPDPELTAEIIGTTQRAVQDLAPGLSSSLTATQQEPGDRQTRSADIVQSQ